MVANGPTVVYPGHPLTLAAIIASLYPSLGAAHERNGSDTPAALADIRIPGAGGNVYAALALLDRLRDGAAHDAAIVGADESWAWCDDQRTRYPNRWREGQEEADKVKAKIGEIAAWAKGGARG